jgi:hypothetical protein
MIALVSVQLCVDDEHVGLPAVKKITPRRDSVSAASRATYRPAAPNLVIGVPALLQRSAKHDGV